MAKEKRKPSVHVRSRGNRFDWLMVGINGHEVCRSPTVYTNKANAKRGGLAFAARHLKLRKVEVVELC